MRLPTLLALWALTGSLLSAAVPAPTPEAVIAEMKRAADWQLAHPPATKLTKPNGWIAAPFYIGLLSLSETSGDPKYRRAVRDALEAVGWQIDERKDREGKPKDRGWFHADDQAFGQVVLDYFLSEPAASRNAAWIAPTRERLDKILADPSAASLDIRKPDGSERWSWSDALFMAPATWQRMTVATGDPKYLDFADREYKATRDVLFDADEGFFFRDVRFQDMKTVPGGAKTFWSRGNGWVYAGLARIIPLLPASDPRRKTYVDLFLKMSPALLGAQQPDGAWFPSLLDPLQNGKDEESGTAFFTYGFAWGVNHGLLPADRYRAAALRGWAALETMVNADGMVGSVQVVSDRPDQAFVPESTVPYGVGGFLLAGSEIARLLRSPANEAPSTTK